MQNLAVRVATMLGGGLGRGGGGGFRGGGGAHYGPPDRGGGGGRGGKGGKGKGRGGGGGRGGPQRGRFRPSLQVRIALPSDSRGRMIGPGGETVKRIQRETGTRIDTPPRHRADAPTRVSGRSAAGVLSCCRAIAEETGGGHDCTCEVEGVPPMASTLRRAAGQPWLFDAAGNDASPAAFAALCLRVRVEECGPPGPDELTAALDDAAFAFGAGAPAMHAACVGAELYVYALGTGAAAALGSALGPLCDRFGAAPPPAADPTRDRKLWLPAAGTLSRASYVAASGAPRRCDAEGFRAAGAVLWRRGADGVALVLMSLEERKGRRGLNFLGGKRDGPEEGAIDVAVRECTEETGGGLSRRARASMAAGMAPAAWVADSKYVLYMHQLGSDDAGLDAVPLPPSKKQKSLHWVAALRLLDAAWAAARRHDFTAGQVALLRPHLAARAATGHARLELRRAAAAAGDGLVSLRLRCVARLPADGEAALPPDEAGAEASAALEAVRID